MKNTIAAAIYYSPDFKVIRTENPYPFGRLYRHGQSFIDNSKSWTVLQTVIDRGIYHVFCTDKMPAYLSDILSSPKSPAETAVNPAPKAGP